MESERERPTARIYSRIPRGRNTPSSGLSSKTAAPNSIGTREPSLRIYSFSNGVHIPLAASSSRAWRSNWAYSGGVIAAQSRSPASCSARV